MPAPLDLEELWRNGRERAERAAAGRGADSHDAEEAASASFMNVIDRAASGHPISDPISYWAQASANAASSHQRRSNKLVSLADTVTAADTLEEDPAHLVERQHEHARVLIALAQLDPDDQSILVQREIEQAAIAALAQRVQISAHAMTMRLVRARERLAAQYVSDHAGTAQTRACRVARAQMYRYCTARLPGTHKARFEQHLVHCGPCTQVLGPVRQLVGELRASAA